jgi:zinc protease
LLTNGKRTPFYEVLVEEEELAPATNARTRNAELAGVFSLRIRTYDGIDLDDALAGFEKAFARFEEGIPDSELERVKAQYETSFYGGVTSVLGKAFQLAHYNIFAPSPGYFNEILERLLAVSAEDVMRVYATYIKDQPYVATSFVPQGRAELALETSERAEVVIEPIVQGSEAAFSVKRGTEITPPIGNLDRSIEPPFGEAPTLSAPTVDRRTLPNGLQVLLSEARETPLVTFEIVLRGGHLLESIDQPGVANLLAQTLTEGTAGKTPDELEQAIDLLGSTIEVRADSQSLVISGSTLARNYDATIALVGDPARPAMGRGALRTRPTAGTKSIAAALRQPHCAHQRHLPEACLRRPPAGAECGGKPRFHRRDYDRGSEKVLREGCRSQCRGLPCRRRRNAGAGHGLAGRNRRTLAAGRSRVSHTPGVG